MPFLNRLIEWGLIIDQSFFGPNAMVAYQWHHQRIHAFKSLNILDNVLFGVGYIAIKYRASVPAIIVSKGEDEYTGSGFVAAVDQNSKRHVVVTAKHNVDSADCISFKGFSGLGSENLHIKPGNDWVLHPTLDLALVNVESTEPISPIFMMGDPSLLKRTITLGYPKIGTTDAPYLLAHGGELNAIVNTYYGETRLIISNAVAPGNSGGPVLDHAGLCLGIVVNSLETTHEGGVEKANSAIPATCIRDFIKPYCT